MTVCLLTARTILGTFSLTVFENINTLYKQIHFSSYRRHVPHIWYHHGAMTMKKNRPSNMIKYSNLHQI